MRHYLANAPLCADGTLTVQGKDYRHLKQVLRLKSGDMLSVRHTDGVLRNMTVCRVDERERRMVLQLCAAPLEQGAASAAESAATAGNGSAASAAASGMTELWLFQLVARSAKMDVIIRQATECGVSVVVPVIGDYSQAFGADRNFRSERYERIIREARQQSGSAVATRVESAVTLPEAIALWQRHAAAMCSADGDSGSADSGTEANANAETRCYGTNGSKAHAGAASLACVLYERTECTQPLHAAVRAATAGGAQVHSAALVCGAEGGISPAELARLCDAGFVPVHFKTNILRCETAALYGIAALQTALSEEESWQ